MKSAGLGVVAADFNGDGSMDIYVANDGDANQLWLNADGKGSFKDGGPLAGVAVNRMGLPDILCLMLSVLVTLVIRIAAIHWGFSLPVFRSKEDIGSADSDKSGSM